MNYTIAEFEVKVSWIEPTFHVEVLFFEYVKSAGLGKKKVIFKPHGNGFYGEECVYQWDSSPSIGLSTIKRNGTLVYDPYSKHNQSEGIVLNEIGRQLPGLLLAIFSNSGSI